MIMYIQYPVHMQGQQCQWYRYEILIHRITNYQIYHLHGENVTHAVARTQKPFSHDHFVVHSGYYG